MKFPKDASQNITYTYDSPLVSYGIGRLTARTDPGGTYGFHYDAQGNLVKEEKKIGGISYITQYGYNKNNVLTSIRYPSGRMIAYDLDQAGQIAQVRMLLKGEGKTLASDIESLPFGAVTGLTYGNGLPLILGYDLKYQISSTEVGSILERSQERNPNGNIKTLTDGVEPARSKIFDYDSLDRLVYSHSSSGAINYTYDPVGNRLKETNGKTTNYLYKAGTNRLTQATGEKPVSFSYDANGNTLTENSRSFTYDRSNRLISVSENGTTIGQYVYNGEGQRVKKVAREGTLVFHYDLSGHLIAETDQTGGTQSEYVYLEDKPLAMIRGENVYYYHNDHLGTPQILTDQQGAIVWKADYKPFGETTILIERVENPLRFPGQYYDTETGLHYNYFRYYNPTTGRYVTPDPIGLEGGINLWPYSGNAPLNWIDPYGLLFGGQINAGEEYGESAAFYWATLSINPNNTWYETGFYDMMGLFASLWTPETSDATFATLTIACPVGKWAGRPYWRYVGPKSNPNSPWLTRGPG